MKSKWDNLFTYQPGDTRSGQLENNTTKNLLKTLQDTDIGILQTFLSESFESLEWPEAGEIDASSLSIERETQIDGWDIDGHRKFLLGISRRNVTEEDPPDEDRKDRIDGTITFSADGEQYAIGIEVKTQESSLGENQIKRYSGAIFGKQNSIEDLESQGVLRTIDWWDVFSTFHDVLMNSLGENTDVPISSQDGIRELEKDEYLLNEFVRYLEYEQLETVIARTGDEYIKRLRMFRYQKSNGRWPEGELMMNLTWENEDGSKLSKIGPQPAKNFEHLLWQIGRRGDRFDEAFDSQYPQLEDESTRSGMVESMTEKEREVRRDIFCAGDDDQEVDFTCLIEWADSAMSLSRNGNANKIASTRMVDGDFDQSGKYRKIYLQTDGGGLYFKLKHYSEKNNPSPQSPPILSSEEFEKLFGCIDSDIRKEVFVEPDIKRLWEHRLAGRL